MKTVKAIVYFSVILRSFAVAAEPTADEAMATSPVEVTHHHSHCNAYPDPECCFEDRHCFWNYRWEYCMPKHHHHPHR